MPKLKTIRTIPKIFLQLYGPLLTVWNRKLSLHSAKRLTARTPVFAPLI
jgi:hypothetical protein